MLTTAPSPPVMVISTAVRSRSPGAVAEHVEPAGGVVGDGVDDGDEELPTICGTGTEDYFGGAWNYEVPGVGYTTYSTPYLGLHQVLSPDGLYRSQQRFGMYRWHLPDPIRFERGLRVGVQALGWRKDRRYLLLQDDIASTAFLYLDRTSANRPPTPHVDDLEIT